MRKATQRKFLHFGSDKSILFLLSCIFTCTFLLGHTLYGSALSASAFFQQEMITVTGTITDTKGVPMIGVTVVQQNTSRGTATDFNGNFTLEMESGSTLEITYVGYKNKTIENVTQVSSPLQITIEEDAAQLDAVVVIGYGEQTKQTLVGAVESVKGEELLKVGSVNTISEALQGQVPGLTAINTNGKPGSDAADLFIRGKSTWLDSSPLVLVDGVQRDLNNIDPNEVASISILKDAAATGVYGVRGANGVILITTKRGKLGAPTFNFTANFGFKLPTATQQKADYLTAQRAWNEAAFNDRNYDNLIPQSTLDAWRQHYGERGPYNPYFPEVDWYDETLGLGYEQTYNLNTRGGSDLIKYFVSLGYRNDGDIFQTKENPEFDPSFGQERYNWRSNFDFDFTSTTKLSVNFSGNYRVRTQPGYRLSGGGEDGFGQPQFFGGLYNAPQNLFPLRYPDDFYGDSVGGSDNFLVFLNEGGQRTYQYYQGFYDAELTQQLDFLTKGLSLKAAVNYTSASNYEKAILRPGVGGDFKAINVIRFYRQFDYSNPTTGPDGSVSYPLVREIRFPSDEAQIGPISGNLPSLYTYRRRLNYRFQLDYKRKFGDHQVGLTGVMRRQSESGRGNGTNVIGFPEKQEEWIGRATYNYKKRYLFQASVNYSGSEKFAPGLRYGLFPVGGVGWVISEEPLIKGFTENWLDFLKVNYSYGITGNDKTARFQYFQSFNSGGNARFGYDNITQFGPLFNEGTPANPNATWEESTQQNLKFTADLMGGLGFELDLWKEQRTDILMARRTIASFTGFPNIPDANVGETKSHGYDLKLSWENNIGEDFSYGINLSTSYFENRYVFRDDPALLADYLKFAGKPIGPADRLESRLLVGGFYQSLDDIFNGPTPSHGLSQNQLVPGDVQYVDYNGDGRTDEQDEVQMENVQFPRRTFSINLNFNWKNLGFNALFYGVTDVGYVFPGPLYFDFAGNFIQANPDVLERWTPETAAIATKPALHVNNSHNASRSDLLYLDGSYLRLKNIEVNYNLKNGFFKRMGLNSLQLYANGNNLFTWSQFDDRIDPETNGNQTYPIVKRYSVGLRASF